MRLLALAVALAGCSLVLDFDDGEPSVDAAVDAAADATRDAIDMDDTGTADAPTLDAPPIDVGPDDSSADSSPEGDAASDAPPTCSMLCGAGAPACDPEVVTIEGGQIEMGYMSSLNTVSICHGQCPVPDATCTDNVEFVGNIAVNDYRWQTRDLVLVSGCYELQLREEGSTVHTCSLEIVP